MNGVELGYQYADSPLILADGQEPEQQFIAYHPNARPGSRLPHMWLADGRPVQDLIGDGYTLLVLDGSDGSAGGQALVTAFGEIGAPFAVLALKEPDLKKVYEYDYLLLRPDMHVAWRGDELPTDARAVAARVTGHQI